MAGRVEAAAARTSHTRSAASFLYTGSSCDWTSPCESLGASFGSPNTTSCKRMHGLANSDRLVGLKPVLRHPSARTISQAVCAKVLLLQRSSAGAASTYGWVQAS